MRRANKGMDPERRVVCGIAAVVAVARDLSEDELRAVADCSFVFEDDANAAFERALERKSGEADHEA